MLSRRRVCVAQRFFEVSSYAADFLLQDNGLLRVAVVVATILLSFYFTQLYGSFEISSPIRLIQQVCFAVGIAFVTQAFLGYLLPGWIVPRNTMILGSAAVLLLIVPWRMLYATLAAKA